MKRRLGFAHVVVLALLATSCGGRSQNERGEPSPSDGGSASGGSSAAGAPNVAGGPNAAGSGGAGDAGAPSATCPSEKPTQGDSCSYQSASNYCVYEIDQCSSVSFECFQHVWLPVPQNDGAAYDCNSFSSNNAPKDGDSCNCMGALDCSYDDCTGRGHIHAVCDNTTWHVTDSACTEQVCGPDGLHCSAGEVCVVHPSRITNAFECVHNSCESTSTNCDCAASLCKAFEECSLDSGTVVCYCPAC
jgi:hypothetical protein